MNDREKQCNSRKVVIVGAGDVGASFAALLARNAHIMELIVDEIVAHGSQAVIVVTSNPVDALTYTALKRTGWPRNRIIGSGTVLDSARFRHLALRCRCTERACLHPGRTWRQ
jgi:L-lactate dehydrogenase